MSRLIKIVCLLIAAVSFPLVLMMAGFAPALMGGGTASMTALQKIAGTSAMAVLLAVPLWVLFFGWRTIQSWRSDAIGSAALMALPACLVIAFFVAVNFSRVAP